MDQLLHTTTRHSTHRVKALIAVGVLISALGYLAITAFNSATIYYYTVEELITLGQTEDGKVARVSGKLEPNSFTREHNSTTAKFSITSGVHELKVTYDGILPDLFFNEHSDIIIEGRLNADGLFEGHNVFVKCPSKYIASD